MMRSTLAIMMTLLLSAGAVQAEGPGLTVPVELPDFDPAAPLCQAPPGLNPVLAFAGDNDRDFIAGVARGLTKAAADRGLVFQQTRADNDPVMMQTQIASFAAAKVGALVVAPIDPVLSKMAVQQVIWSGAYVGAIVPPPATSILNAPQYLTGKTLGDAAAAYIADKLNGQANVVLLTHDSLEFLAPRFAAIRDSLRSLPGVTIVADVSPRTVDRAGGAETMRIILLAEAQIDVVLGADTVVLGALDAMRAAGQARPEQFFGGIDGETDAITELTTPGSPYKTTINLAAPIFGYAMGQHAADWLEGKSIPQAMDILPAAINSNNLARFQIDIADPAAVWNNSARRDRYLRMYGNICYDTRDQYLNFPWSSEAD
ncbi:MAG: sugar ABC transporter substrate-binding protein [Candidatus Saccharibacteria bacterium]|nr:sugar ABC transporter substrate-binding protein [Pseudorhodobacter sp.]